MQTRENTMYTESHCLHLVHRNCTHGSSCCVQFSCLGRQVFNTWQARNDKFISLKMVMVYCFIWLS